MDLIATLQQDFPLTDVRIIGETRQKAFIRLFGAILRMRNLLVAFDDFKGMEILSERDMQDYMGRYQDLYDEWRGRSEHEKEDITDDVVFEIELIKQIEINIDYILMLMQNTVTAMARIRKSPSPFRRLWSQALSSAARRPLSKGSSPVSMTWMMWSMRGTILSPSKRKRSLRH